MLSSEPSQQCVNFFDIIVIQCVPHLSDMGFDFIVIVLLRPSAVASSLSLDIGYLFLVGSSVLSIIVQQLVTVLVLSQEDKSVCPSTPPS